MGIPYASMVQLVLGCQGMSGERIRTEDLEIKIQGFIKETVNPVYGKMSTIQFWGSHG